VLLADRVQPISQRLCAASGPRVSTFVDETRTEPHRHRRRIEDPRRFGHAETIPLNQVECNTVRLGAWLARAK
jgi:hypothetical protein